MDNRGGVCPHALLIPLVVLTITIVGILCMWVVPLQDENPIERPIELENKRYDEATKEYWFDLSEEKAEDNFIFYSVKVSISTYDKFEVGHKFTEEEVNEIRID